MSKRVEASCNAERSFYLYCTKYFVRSRLSKLQKLSAEVLENNMQQYVRGRSVQSVSIRRGMKATSVINRFAALPFVACSKHRSLHRAVNRRMCERATEDTLFIYIS